MNAAELLQNILAAGADKDGIDDRFNGNAELYASCFSDFIHEPNFEKLDEALAEKDYPAAFDAAHALKGLAGNLGVTAFYDAICALVETLRAGEYGPVATEYAQVQRQRKKLLALYEGEQPEPEEPPAPQTFRGMPLLPPEAPSPIAARMSNGRFLLRFIGATLIVILAVGSLFSRINHNYHANIVQESSLHLIETSNQIKLYVEESIADDWRVASSVRGSIEAGHYTDDESIFQLLRAKRDIWGVSNLMLYTENGYCVYADGQTETNDIASDTVVKARQSGQYMSIIDSTIICTVPVTTDILYNGSRIVAISVVQQMQSFLDNMHFSAFGEQAWMYLTEESGVVISALTNKAAVPTFNFRSIVQDAMIEPLKAGATAEDLFSAESPSAFLVTKDAATNYVVSVPIHTSATPLRLFYLAPEMVVNKTMNGFSSQLTSFSITMIGLTALLAFTSFLFFYLSRKKRFDKELEARDRMFDLLIQNTQTAFALFAVNEETPSYISHNAKSVIGDSFWVITKDDAGYQMRNDTNTDTETMQRANEMLRGWNGQTAFKSGYLQNDSTTPPSYFEYQLYPIDSAGTTFVGIALDVTQAHEREEATKAAMELAKRANEAKSRFLSNMSHDIRTPMNAIMNMTNFALENIDRPKLLGEYLHTIHESTEHLLLLINDVLDMSRIESGRTTLAHEAFDLRAALTRQVDMVQSLCQGKEQTLITDFSGLCTTAFIGDELKLSQVIMNLLANAIKFTPEKGAVRFIAKEIPSLNDDLVDVRFTIEDNGIGISPEDLTHIFDPFFRTDSAQVDQIEGTGLGLSICKSYVDAMGGTIHCESEEGEGSTFTVELFLQKASSTAVSHAGREVAGGTPFLGMHCLIVEDNATNQRIARTLLTRLGFIVDMANNGALGAQEFLQSPAHTYDVIYMDIRMPVLDGYQATIRIRESTHPDAKTIPIVAMSANVYPEDMEKARVAGIDAYLGKPLVSFELIEQTRKAFAIKKGTQA